MTKGVSFLFAFYLLVAQPALVGRLRNDSTFYQLAGFNAGILIIAGVIMAILCGAKKEKKSDLLSDKDTNNDKSEESLEKTENEIKESLEETKEEKQDEENEKNDDSKSEKVQKETVSIPKIVQPLSGHHTKTKKKKDIKYGQRLVLLCTLVLAAIIARILWEFFGIRSIAVALLLGRIFYLIIGKLADIDGFYKAKKLFTNRLYILLILGAIGYGVYNMQQSDQKFNSDFWVEIKDKTITYVKNRFSGDKESDIQNETGVVYVFEGTGEVLDPLFVMPDVDSAENENLSGEDLGENVEISDDENKSDSEEITAQTEISDVDLNKNVTMGEAIKHLLLNATLSTKTTSTFKYVSKNNELYPYFKTAQEKGMIGTDTDPSKIVSCETYITMKGLSEGRNVGSYVKSEIRTAYWNKAKELGKLNGCEKGKYLTQGTL